MREETIAIGALQLECGAILSSVEQHVTIYGTPCSDGSNVVLVAHALTGSSRVADWWPGIVGEGALFDARRWCAIGGRGFAALAIAKAASRLSNTSLACWASRMRSAPEVTSSGPMSTITSAANSPGRPPA